jgi:lipopolysaccharide/colanic/teichoic acid biosynthesis glycosyltransferase
MTRSDLTPRQFLDILVSVAILLLFSPLVLLLAVAVKTTSPGPVFFKGERVGRGGRPFRMIKFRTMVGNAHNLGPPVTAQDDPRITPIGRLLRRTKLDELPTLLNVLRGEMRIVGPRPEAPFWVNLYTPEERKVLLIHPGITSPASIQYRHEERLLAGKRIEESYPPIMRNKLRIEMEYLRTRSFLKDLEIIPLTIRAIFK